MAGLDLAAQEASIRELINEEAPLLTVLRLVCLLSVISGGLKPKVVDELKREILQVSLSLSLSPRDLTTTTWTKTDRFYFPRDLKTYGHAHLPLLVSLTRLGLLSRPSPTGTTSSSSSSSSSKKSAFATARKPLRLIVDDVDESHPVDMSYVYSGYAPVTVRLVQCALGGSNAVSLSSSSNGGGGGGTIPGRGGGAGPESLNGWKGLEELLKAFEGDAFDEWQVNGGGKRTNLAQQQPPSQGECFFLPLSFPETVLFNVSCVCCSERRSSYDARVRRRRYHVRRDCRFAVLEPTNPESVFFLPFFVEVVCMC